MKFQWNHKISLAALSSLLVLTLIIALTPARNDDDISVYRKVLYDVPKTFDPIRVLSSSDHTISNLLYDGLFAVDDRLEVSGSLATKWEISDDGKTYQFWIRKDVSFHDGSHLTTDHVAESLRRLIAEDSPVVDTFRRMDSVNAIDAERIEVKLNAAYPPFISLLAAPVAKITKPTESGYALGTGPFIVSDFREIDGHRVLVLTRNSTYSGPKPKIEVLELWQGDEDWAIKQALVGFIHDTAAYTSKSGLSKDSDRTVEIVAPAAVTWMLSMNNSKPVLSSRNTRACLIEKFPRDQFVARFTPDQLVAAGFLPPTMPGSGLRSGSKEVSDTPRCSDTQRVTLTLDYPKELGNGDEMCVFIQESYSRFGFDIKCQRLPFADLLGRISNKDADLSLLAMTLDYPSVEYFLSVFESTASFNIANYSSESFDRHLEAARMEPDRTKRIALYEMMNSELSQNAVTINISYPQLIAYRHKCLSNFNAGFLGDPYIDYRKISLHHQCKTKGDFSEPKQR